MIVGFTAGVFGARLASRIGIRRVLVLTGAIGAAGFAILTQLPATGHYSPLLAAVMLVGFGTAGTAFGTMVIATSGVAGAEQGVVGGVVNTSRQIGAAAGAAVLPAISAAVSHNGGIATAHGNARGHAGRRDRRAAGHDHRLAQRTQPAPAGHDRGRGPSRQHWLARPSGGARHPAGPSFRCPGPPSVPDRPQAAGGPPAKPRRSRSSGGPPARARRLPARAPGSAPGGSEQRGTTAR